MKIIVTGATSFIGKAVIKELKENGHDIIPLRHSFEGHGSELPETADAWMHFAWGGKGSANRANMEVQMANVGMTMDALNKAVSLKCRRFVFAGSQAEYGFAQNGTLKKEDGAIEPVTPYGMAKEKVLEGALRRTGSMDGDGRTEYVHARIFSVYGPGDHHGSLIDSLTDNIYLGKPMDLGPCDQDWDFLYIDDAARALRILCEKAPEGIYNVGSGDIRKLKDYVLSAAEAIRDNGGRLLRFGTRGNNAEGNAGLSPDISRIRELGFKPQVPFAEGIRRIIEAKNRMG